MHPCYISQEILSIVELILEDFMTTFKEQNDGKYIWPWAKAFCFVQECIFSCLLVHCLLQCEKLIFKPLDYTNHCLWTAKVYYSSHQNPYSEQE